MEGRVGWGGVGLCGVVWLGAPAVWWKEPAMHGICAACLFVCLTHVAQAIMGPTHSPYQNRRAELYARRRAALRACDAEELVAIEAEREHYEWKRRFYGSKVRWLKRWALRRFWLQFRRGLVVAALQRSQASLLRLQRVWLQFRMGLVASACRLRTAAKRWFRMGAASWK